MTNLYHKGILAKCAAAVGALMMMWSTTHAASFDCQRASTPTEKDICSNAELSALDKEMARVYAETLPRASPIDKGTLVDDQRRWLGTRDRCASPRIPCLLQAYVHRLAVLKEYGARGIPRRRRGEMLQIQPESAKLKIILEMARARPFARWIQPDDPPYCKRTIDDLARGESLEAIEPNLRTEAEQDPGLQRLNLCTGPDRPEADDPGFQFFGPDQLTGPPYRYYQIEVDGDPDNGLEDVLYHEGDNSGMNSTPGYTWVMVDKCTIGGGAPLARYAFYGINVLAKYRDEVITLELTAGPRDDDGKEIAYWLHAYRLRHVDGEPYGCTWQDFRIPRASFYCPQATSQIEKTICLDEELSRLDIALAKAYRAARVRSGNVAVQDQRKWLRARNACKDTSCIRRAYQARLEELRGPKYRSTATLAARRSGPSYFATAPHASIDEVINGCFADAECGRQLEKEMAENTAPGADVTNAALRNCLGSQRTMNICVGTWLGSLAQELEETLLLATAKVNAKCEALLLERHETWTRAVSNRCEQQAFGQTGGGQATSGLGSSCEIDFYQQAVGALWEAEGCSDCSRCLQAFQLPNP